MRIALALVMVVLLSTVAHANAIVVVVDRTVEPDKIAAVTHAFVTSLDTFDPKDEIAIVSYGTTARVEGTFVSAKNKGRISDAFARIPVAKTSTTATGLRFAADLLKRSKAPSKMIVLVTDAGRGDPEIGKLRAKGTRVLVMDSNMKATIKAAAANQPSVPETLAVVLVIDRSGSMQGPKLEAAKEAARVTTEVLGADDTIAVIAFDTESQVFVKPQRAANKAQISSEISHLTAGGGTNMYPALKEAYETLQAISATQKHVIVLGDGETPDDGIQNLVKDMHTANITVSAVGLPGADRKLLSMIADAGSGRLYMVDDIGALPRIFMKEVSP